MPGPSRAKVVVIGSSNTDMVVKCPRLPAPGETVLGGEFVMTGGGKGANQAVAAARLGAHVELVARVGRDPFGEAALRGLEGEGIGTRFVARDADAPSGVALIFVGEGGENEIVVAPGANGRLQPGDVDAAEAAIAAADIVLLQLEVPLDTVAHAARAARRHGVAVLLNPAPARPLPPDLLQAIDVLTPNEGELAVLARGTAAAGGAAGVQALAEGLLAAGAGAVVVTLGSAGAAIARRGSCIPVPAFPVEALDTTAAGDCFSGALAVALAEGSELPPAARFAAAAAALSVTRLGAQASMPARAEVERLLDGTAGANC